LAAMRWSSPCALVARHAINALADQVGMAVV
jgi:hypothetical protein